MALTNKMKEVLRQRLGLDEDDTSMDNHIEKMSPTRIVREMSSWEIGTSVWADIFAAWMVNAGAKPEDFK